MPKAPLGPAAHRQLALRQLAAAALVGRDEELQALLAAVQKVTSGAGSAVFVSGEPGIGKTRLVAEAVSESRRRGHLTLTARAYPLEDALAYGVFSEAISAHLKSLSGAERADLLTEVPGLGALIGAGASLDPHFTEPSLTKAWLLDAIARFVERLSANAPLVIALDDLHLADASSRDAVHYLARRIAELPVLLIATHRSEAAAARPLAPLVVSLRRQQLISEVRLGRLPQEAVRQLVGATLGGEAPRDLLHLLEARAGGTPLFVETILRELLTKDHLRHEGEGWVLDQLGPQVLPDAVRDLVLEQLLSLGRGARQVVDLLAVAAEPLSLSALSTLTQVGDGRLSRALQEVVELGLVAEQQKAGAAFALSHPLIEEAVYLELPESARQQAHAALARLIESSPPAPERLARHYRGAGTLVDRERAVNVLIDAGERAQRLNATAEALQHFQAALELLEPSATTPVRASLLERLGELENRMGDSASAVRLLSEAADAYLALDQRGSYARVCALLAVTSSDRGDLAMGKDHLDRALAVLSRGRPSQDLVEVRQAELRILTRLGDFAAASQVAGELVELAMKLSSHRAVAEAQLAAAEVHFSTTSYHLVRESLLSALEEAQQGGETMLVLRARHLLALLALTLGESVEARRHSEAGLSIARQLRSPVLELNPMASAAEADQLAGRWNEALERSREALAMARRLERPRVGAWMLAVRAAIYTLRGDFDSARACLAEARDSFPAVTEDRNILVQMEVAEEYLALEHRLRPPATVLSARLGVSPTTMLPLRLALAAEAEVQAGRIRVAVQIAARLSDIKGGEYPGALAARLRGLIAMSTAELSQARLELESAAEAFRRLELPFEEAQVRLALGMVVARGAGKDHLTFAARQFELLGAQPYAARARGALRALRSKPAEAAEATARVSMTRRESEVARLVAEGLSNPEVAEVLHLSPRTVTTHLSHIYERTGLRSRAALARYVAETGIGSARLSPSP